MTPLTTLKNLGPKSREWLEAVGIHTAEDVVELGAVEVYRRLKAAFPDRVSLNALWGLQAAIMNIHWKDLPPEIKQDLLSELNTS
ncbi:MAG: hypothetical protein OHK0046_09890 [Anaerolineae bacterium]